MHTVQWKMQRIARRYRNHHRHQYELWLNGRNAIVAPNLNFVNIWIGASFSFPFNRRSLLNTSRLESACGSPLTYQNSHFKRLQWFPTRIWMRYGSGDKFQRLQMHRDRVSRSMHYNGCVAYVAYLLTNRFHLHSIVTQLPFRPPHHRPLCN